MGKRSQKNVVIAKKSIDKTPNKTAIVSNKKHVKEKDLPSSTQKGNFVIVETKKNEKVPKEKSCGSAKGNSKMTLSSVPTTTVARQYRERRPGRPPSGKRPASSKDMPGKLRTVCRRSLDPCDNSNDSGLGFDHHTDHRQTMGISERLMPIWSPERTEIKRPRLEIKVEHEEVNDNFSFPESIRSCKENTTALIRTAPSGSIPSLSISNNQHNSSGRAVPRCMPINGRHAASPPVPLTSQFIATSRLADVTLSILKQPEQQHRARYQTEGSRGAVKDREGNGFPIVQLGGYYKPATLQVFIGTDVGKVSPHMFYQACKVSGKNSTPCSEKKLDGTCVIEVMLDPAKDMSATCDCVGILKERNVDVEHRFPEQLGNRSKKKSTRCRMIFRTTITHEDGTLETLQVCSQPIVCTQPPGVPEICKKSLTSCPAGGGLELFVLGKNFLKDTKVYFQKIDEDRVVHWEQAVVPDKEYLQQTHFVCVVPPYRRPDITEPVTVRLCVVSSGKTSESHQFVYTPVNGAMPSVRNEAQTATPLHAPFFNKMAWTSPPSASQRDQDLGMMPPPESNLVPLSTRRPSLSLSQSGDSQSPPMHVMKQEYIDENSQSSIMDVTEVRSGRFRHVSESSMDMHHQDSNLSFTNDNSMDMMHRGMNENSNMSMNENSVEMVVRRRTMSSMCENSMDVNMGNSNFSILSDDSSCSTAIQSSTSLVTDRMVTSQSIVHSQDIMASSRNDISNASVEDLKVIDLRMKMPMATVADLAGTTAPSLATLQNFEVSGPLFAQSGQSVENFLTKIESSPKNTLTTTDAVSMSSMSVKDQMTQEILHPQVRNISPNYPTTTEGKLSQLSISTLPLTLPAYLNSQMNCVSHTAGDMVTKSEAASIGERSESTALPSMSNSILIPADRLNALVKSTVESYMRDTRSETQKDVIMVPSNSQSNMLMASQDVMMNPPNLMVSPVMNTSSTLPDSHTSPNLSPEVILNSQISPSLMCRNTNGTLSENLLPPSTLNQMSNNLHPNLISTQVLLSPGSSQHSPIEVSNSPIQNQLGFAQESAVLLEAAVDLLQTQKKISELDHNSNLEAKTDNILELMTTSNSVLPTSTLSQLQCASGNGFITQTQTSASLNQNLLMPVTESTSTAIEVNKRDFVLPVTVKEMQLEAGTSQSDKKNEDRMIPQSFTANLSNLTEKELIEFINPSCFDQV